MGTVTVTGFTAARMLAIEASTVFDGWVDLEGHLILKTRNGTEIDAGNVKGTDGLDATIPILTVTDTPSIDFTLTGSPETGYALTAKSALTLIGALADLNTYLTQGVFIQTTDAQALGGAHYPIGYSGILEVTASTTGWCYQRYTTYLHGGDGNKIYTRSLYSGAWSNWALVAQSTIIGRQVGEPFFWLAPLTASIPTGCLALEGGTASRTTYSELWALWGTLYGAGDGTTTFGLPDMRGKSPFGYDASQTEFNAVGKTGGEKTHTLIAAEVPVLPVRLQGSETSGAGTMYSGGTRGTTFGYSADSVNPSTGAFPWEALGGGGAHQNMPPYLVGRWLVKAAYTGAEINPATSHIHAIADVTGLRTELDTLEAAPIPALVRVIPVSTAYGIKRSDGSVYWSSSIPVVSLNGIFTSKYSDYLIRWRTVNSDSNSGTNFCFRVNGVDYHPNSYQRSYFGSAGTSVVGQDTLTYGLMALYGHIVHFGELHLHNPHDNDWTRYSCEAMGTQGANAISQSHVTGLLVDSTIIDGITIYPSAGTLASGWVEVYAYNTAPVT